MKIKICGITVLEDALAALDAGADMLGFNFYPLSPRCIARTACAEMIAAIRSRGYGATLVGVFVNLPPDEVRGILDECGLDLAQLSGDEPPADLMRLRERAFKAIRPRDVGDAVELTTRYARRGASPALLVDAATGAGQFGGTGRTGDWDAARVAAAQHPILLAGGLRPENVAAAIAAARPWGVDVASGVEASPGRKDAAKMKAFVRAAHG